MSRVQLRKLAFGVVTLVAPSQRQQLLQTRAAMRRHHHRVPAPLTALASGGVVKNYRTRRFRLARASTRKPTHCWSRSDACTSIERSWGRRWKH